MRARLASLLFVSGFALAQPPADTVDFRARDDQHVATLSGDQGTSAMAGRIAVYVPAGTMTRAEVQALAESLNRGFDGLVAFTHSPRAWQRIPAKVSYYFHSEMYISHADGENDRLFIAFPRLLNGQAPLLHEATHVLLYPNAEFVAAHPELLDESAEGSVWLGEGLASYVGFSVAEETGVQEGDPLAAGAVDDVDSRCATALSTPVGAELLPYVAAPGAPAALTSRARRLEVAPSFYACATSFTKFTVEAVGIEQVVDAMAAADSESVIARAAGKSIDVLKAEWLREIGPH